MKQGDTVLWWVLGLLGLLALAGIIFAVTTAASA